MKIYYISRKQRRTRRNLFDFARYRKLIEATRMIKRQMIVMFHGERLVAIFFREYEGMSLSRIIKMLFNNQRHDMGGREGMKVA